MPLTSAFKGGRVTMMRRSGRFYEVDAHHHMTEANGPRTHYIRPRKMLQLRAHHAAFRHHGDELSPNFAGFHSAPFINPYIYYII